jgi:predicted extracellular nuclease
MRCTLLAAVMGSMFVAGLARAEHLEIGACGEPATLISTIQGKGTASPLYETERVIEGVVVGNFQDNSFKGFFVQEEEAQQDSDPDTSEGLFVFQGPQSDTKVAVGNVVRVVGTVYEFENLTELTYVKVIVCPGKQPVKPLELKVPFDSGVPLERYEGMLIRIAQPLTVTGNDELARYGTLDFSIGGRLFAPTQIATKGEAALAQQRQNDERRVFIDDGDGRQNPKPIPFKTADNTLRVGTTIPGVLGIFDEHFGRYRILPTEPLKFDTANPRPPVPPKAGTVRVVSANVLNYFTTLDERTRRCGPAGDQTCRGANNAAELTRQRAKLLSALIALDADVYGLLEIENTASDAVTDIVAALNKHFGAATYAYVDTGTIGEDAIRVALIYRKTLELIGKFALLDTSVDKRFLVSLNRPVLAQTFEERETGGRFTVALNHWKSKGSDCNDVGDRDLNDGQGNCNMTRTNAARALLDWLGRDPTGSEDPDRLVIGDLNSYAKEDPIVALESGGYTSLVAKFVGPEAYSYQYQGQSGYLDHALASAALLPQVAALREWHINADEPTAVDYNTEFRPDDLYKANEPFRMSDHDPLVIDLKLTPGARTARNLAIWVGAPGVVLVVLLLRVLQLRRARRDGKAR